jgi:proteasome accessory factor C
VGTASIGVQGDTAWWVHRTLSDAGALEDGVFETPYARLEPLGSWILRQNGRAVPLAPPELRRQVADGLALLRERHTGAPLAPARERRTEVAEVAADRQIPGPVAPERFGVLQALLAHLLSACGDGKDAHLDADDLADRFSIPREELQEHLSLLNLVNFGGGCYTVYAEVNDDTGLVRVDKELYGDVFRKPPKLTPLEARAIRLAIEYVGPTIAAAADTPLDRVRRKLEETFGQFELSQTAAPRIAYDEEELVKTLSEGAEHRRVVEIAYLKEGEEQPSHRLVEPYTIERELPFWRVHTWDRSVDAPRTFRLDRMREARLTEERFEARDGYDPNYLSETQTARLWHAPAIARWKLERGARALTDRSAISEPRFKDEEWLLSEVLADRGETVVLEPDAMRASVARRAKALATELGLTTRRRKTAGPA